MSSDQETAPAQWKQEWASPPIIHGAWFDVRPADAGEMLQILISSLVPAAEKALGRPVAQFARKAEV